MQNVQNNFTVENLVAKYRNYVTAKCPKSADESVWQDKDGYWHNEVYDTPIPTYRDADEQLLVTMYKHVSGNNADERVLAALSKYAEAYYYDALTEEEFSFLCSNFEEAVAFSFSYLKEHKGQMGYEPVPLEMVDIIKDNITVKKRGSVFVADANNGDVASLFSGCRVKGFTSKKESWIEEELWALTQIRLYSQGISSDIHVCEENCIDASYLDDVDYIVWGTAYHSSYDEAKAVYESAKPGTQMILFLEDRKAAGKEGETYDIRKTVVGDRAVKSVISFEYKDMWLSVNRVKIALILEKNTHDTVHIKNGITGEDFDVPATVLDHELLWPSFYSTMRPDFGIPLSDIVTFVDLTDREVIKDDGDWTLPEEIKQMPVAVPAKMGKEYKDANLLIQDLDLAGSKVFDDQWKFWIRVLKEPCILLYGNKEKTVVGYIREMPETGIATLDTIVCIVPKAGIDVRYIAALLLSPEVKGQLESICQGSINDQTFPLVMNKVIVPNHSDKERVDFLSEANYEAIGSLRAGLEATYKEKYDAMKADYINEVCMRKHDMRPHLRQLASSVRLMIHYIDNCNDLEELKSHLHSQLGYTHEALANLSIIVDNLANEEKFGTPEVLNLDKLLEEIEINHNDNEGFTIEYDCDRESFKKAGLVMPDLLHQIDGVYEHGGDMKQFIQSLAKRNLPLFVEMAPVDFQRLSTNIIDNARNHGFTDKSRTDYYLGIDFSYNPEKEMYQIDFSNNGNPLPSGMTKERFGIRGEKAGEHGGTGNGGYIIKSIISHYGGDFDVLTKDGLTIIRIYLPINK